MRALRFGPLLALLLLPNVLRAAKPTSPPFSDSQLEFFEKQVRPLLVARCYECHNHKLEEPKGSLSLDSRQAALAGGDTGPAVTPGDLEESLLIDAVRYGDLYQMPPKSKLSAEEIAILEKWVRTGAAWPPGENATHAPMKKTFDLAGRKQKHWVWRPLEQTPLPQVQNTAWPRQPLDFYILRKLEDARLQPAPRAEKRVLIRRLYFDLTGLPPRAEDVASFLADARPDAWERRVEQLLASPRLGPRWARHWFDLVRYAESRGHEFDYNTPNAHQYRDYVVRAWNADVPFDQFTTEHIAGDLLSNPRRHPFEGFNESILGTGFWFMGEWVHSPVDIRRDETDRFDNMIDVATKTFLGLTVSCARCHDHKFDAITQQDYYAFSGFLQSSAYRQVRFDSLDANRILDQELGRMQQTGGRRITRLQGAAWRQPAASLANVLLAALSEPTAKTAEAGGKTETPTAEITAWRKEIKAARNRPHDPLYPLAKAKEKGRFDAQVFSQSLQTWRKALQEQNASLQNVEVVLDFSKSEKCDWRTDGPTFGAAPVQPGEFRLYGGGSEKGRIAPYAAAVRDPFWNGLQLAPGSEAESGRTAGWKQPGRTLRTPTFTIAPGKVYYLVRGSAHVYAVVDSHRVNQGPLHGSLLKSFDKLPQPQWVAHDLSRYTGHGVHLEFTAIDDQPLEILMVVQGAAPPANPQDAPSAPLLEMLQAAAPQTAEAAAEAYQQVFETVCQTMAQGELAAPSGRRWAAVADWLWRHPALLPEGASAAGELTAEVTSLQQRRGQLAARVVATSRTAPAMWDGSGEDENVLVRGNPNARGLLAPRQLLSALVGQPDSAKETAARAAGSGRLELAREMLDPQISPLVPRVRVNRLWHHLFGRGIVPTVDNFGLLGEPPTHPALLDFLALELVRQDWSLKQMLRTMVLSSTYQMSSRLNAAADQADPANALLHRMRLRRLEGEVIRDAILAVSSRLDETMAGPSVPIHLTPFMDGRGRPARSGPLDGGGRRSIYVAVRRNFLSPMMLAFDTPTPFSTVGRRNISNVPAQALILLNDPFVISQARVWAEAVLASPAADDDDAVARVERMYMQAFARPPNAHELAAALQFLQEQLQRRPNANRLDAWADLGHVLLNTKEFVFLN